MLRSKKLFPAFLPGFLLVVLLLAAGCGHDSFFRDEQSPPLSSDVIVIGDSLTALVAALEAARNGASVLIFYDQPDEDRWLWDEGSIAAGEPEGEEHADIAIAELREVLVAYGSGGGQSWHFDRLAENSGFDFDWLAGETGLEMVQEQPFRFSPENLSMAQVYERLTTAALNEGVRFLPEIDIQELMIDEQENKVIGVRFSATAGTERDAYAPAVILADGGFLGNEALMEELAPEVRIASWRSSQTGLGWRAAMEAELDLVDANLFAFAPAIKDNEEWVKADWPAGTLLIVEDRIISLAGFTGGDLVAELLGSGSLTGYLLVAETQLGLETELNWSRYEGIDAFMEAYHLDLPLLRRWYVQPWDVFYGRQVTAVAEYCLGGIAVNENGVTLRGGEPVRGLYAVGEISGGLHGLNLMPGAALSESVVWGRFVGRCAAEEALQ